MKLIKGVYMAGIFDNHNTKEQVLSVEMIDHQINDPFVKEMIDMVGDVINIIRDEALFSNKKIFKDMRIKTIFKRMDLTIRDRFGIRVKLMGYDGTLYAIFPSPPISTSAPS
jgi:hypothetical protein